MENIIEIDLDKNLIIPIKEPFNKKQLIDTLSLYWGYDKGEEKVNRKTFVGTQEELLQIVDGKEYAILAYDKDTSTWLYDIKEFVPFEQTKTEWVIAKYLKPSTDALIAILLEMQTKEMEEQNKTEIEAIKAGVLEQLEIIRNITLQ